MRIAVCLTKKNRWSQQLVDACCKGVAAHGDEPLVVFGSNDLHHVEAADAAIVTCEAKRGEDTGRFSIRNTIADICDRRGIHRLVIETGFIRNVRNRQRGETSEAELYWATGWGGIKRGADYCVPRKWDDSRWIKLGMPIIPKVTRSLLKGGHVLVFGQVDNGVAEVGVNLIEEYARVADACRRLLPSCRVIFRPHPQSLIPEVHFPEYARQVAKLGYTVDRWEESRELILRARVAVTWMSNASIDALLMGVPIICLSELNPCWEVSEHDIENIADPYFPEQARRQRHANYLAWCQWTVEEIASGEAWARLRTKLTQEREEHELPALRSIL